MRVSLISIAAVLGIAMSMASFEASATTQRSARKHKTFSSVASRHHRHARASISDAKVLAVASASALVQDQSSGSVLFEKNSVMVAPIASITKLMTAMVVLDAVPDLDEILTISNEDLDALKGTHSRLAVGTRLSRESMLRLALMSSENRAAAALSRYYPGGRPAFVMAMNRKAQSLGLSATHFEDPTGLTAANVSTARELEKMVEAAHTYPLIRAFTTTAEYQVAIRGRMQTFRNTNVLVRDSDWDIGLSKTGYINEAGKCLVMQAWLNNKPVVIVLLDASGKLTRIADARRIRRWIESAGLPARQVTG